MGNRCKTGCGKWAFEEGYCRSCYKERRTETPMPVPLHVPPVGYASAASLGDSTVHLPPIRAVPVSAKVQADWEIYGGPSLESLLKNGSIALLDAQWLVEEAARGGVLRRRQELPDEAFLCCEEVKAFGVVDEGLPIAAISYPWLTPQHPDPHGSQLKLLAAVLEAFLAGDGRPQRWALFWECAHAL